MMSNLFSIFDPSTSMNFSLNWISSWMNIFFTPTIFWLLKSRILKLINNIFNFINKEFLVIFNNKFNFINTIYFVNLMLFIFLNNFLGLYPYIFTSSSHLIFSLTFSLPLWIGLMLFGWMKNTNFMFSHMIPQGTPSLLMPFMVLIETISNFIRPGTLAVRLTANLIAGHLLLTLMSNSALSPFLILSILIILMQIILLILEFSVSIIQSYVFSILSTLYTKETN